MLKMTWTGMLESDRDIAAQDTDCWLGRQRGSRFCGAAFRALSGICIHDLGFRFALPQAISGGSFRAVCFHDRPAVQKVSAFGAKPLASIPLVSRPCKTEFASVMETEIAQHVWSLDEIISLLD